MGSTERYAVGRRFLRARREDLILQWPLIAQTTAAATAAWLIAHNLAAHPDPFFAPVAAVVSLAISYRDRVARAIEVTAGVCLGVAIGWPCLALGRATVAAIVVALASGMAMAVACTGRRLALLQTTTSALLMVTVSTPATLASTRIVDALIGGLTSVAVGVLAFPIDPQRLARRTRAALLEGLAGVFDEVSDALARQDPHAAREATRDARALESLVASDTDAATTGAQTARGSLWHRAPFWCSTERTPVDVEALGLITSGTGVLARTALRVLETGAPRSDLAVQAIELLSTAVRSLPGGSAPGADSEARAAAISAATTANGALHDVTDLYLSTVFAHIRTIAAELLQVIGDSETTAANAVRKA